MEQIDEKAVTEESVFVVKKERKHKQEAAEVELETESVKPSASKHKYEVSAEDLIETLYTYASSPLKKGNFKNAGKCLLCGTPTAAVERKICWECINKHRDEIVVG